MTSGSGACPFCDVDRSRLAFERPLVLGLWDAFPVNPGHLLLVTRRHVSSWFEATTDEQSALMQATVDGRACIEGRYRPDGFNVGVNVGTAGGQTVPHLHVHLIPRYAGDVRNPRGGVRQVIPAKADYLAGPASDSAAPPRLVTGGEQDPLLPYLIEQLGGADLVDIAVGFVLPSGVGRLEEHFRDLLRRGGRLRLLTGDYLGVTDPDALMRLLDLEGQRELRVFETVPAPLPAWPGPLLPVSFHPKAYVFRRHGGDGVAFIGSSNLSESALTTGIEWSYRVVASQEGTPFGEIVAAFERLFGNPATRELTADWVEGYRARRPVREAPGIVLAPVEVPLEPRRIPEPHVIQQAALQALDRTRAAGNTAGLVVLATGLGKTWLSAFDSNRAGYRRILFIAHREEILDQAIKTFRQIRPEARIGHYTGERKDARADILFASIQTLGRAAHLERFAPDEFDYVVVDEFHHAAARTYRRLIEHFQPKFLLGLTATPERTDGGDLLALCQENLVYRCDLVEGVRRDLLCRFRYFGVPDEVDYTNIPWRNSRFDEDELTRHVATQSRAENALAQLRKHGGSRTMAFCVSQRHADFMARFFRERGLRAVAVHSGETSAPRAASLEELSAGHLDVICAVDVFNEGLDLPELDTILMLRPTESRVVWLQQFGRGLRKTIGDKVLTVVDYIGNHRAFLLKPQTLFNLGPGDHEVFNLLERARQGPIEIAPGCFVTYELETIDVLRGLLRTTREPEQALRRYYEDFRERHGVRPTAVEAYHDGYNPRSVRRRGECWHAFVGSMGDLSADQARVVERHRSWLEAVETTEMTRSYKMVVLLGMLNADAFPGSVGIEDLVSAARRVAAPSAHLKAELLAGGEEPAAVRALLEKNPLLVWTGGRGTGGVSYFSYRDGVFSTAFEVDPADRPILQELTRELVEWRLAEYLSRIETRSGGSALVCAVKHSGGRPILFLPDREEHPELPSGTTTVVANGEPYEAEFAKVAVNVLRRAGLPGNELPGVLRGWFGADAGLPGTAHAVALEHGSDGSWTLRPLGGRREDLQLWRRYSREEIPPLFGLPFSDAIWNVGFVTRPGHMFLLVTLDKGGKAESFQYRDRFLSPTVFQWESQNRTRQGDARGQAIREHAARGIAVHLFVRRASKADGRSAPFVYCGDVRFRDWEGERPITVRWELAEGVPERLREELQVVGSMS